MGIKTVTGNQWTSHAVAYIIKNPVYIRKITWKKQMEKKFEKQQRDLRKG
jgi:site-specific DNA recombinase